MIELLTDPTVWASLITLTALEIVLGIDNVVFISVVTSKLSPELAKRARQIGLMLALVFRIILLFFISAIVALKDPVFTAFGLALSWKDIILIVGGGFLIWKAVGHIHDEVEEDAVGEAKVSAPKAFNMVIGQIVLIDLVFSVDSIITAVGLADHIEVMVAAVVIAVGVMYVAAGPVSAFIERHPTTKVLALAFLLLIGVALVADGLGFHIPRGYIYTAMAFSAAVEAINIVKRRKKNRPM
ncbi:TerC family protein [Prosthecodimorpha staleyi]|uniref:TerC family protein n=1 Tax=Prosthecodimorpha staleyi TaxID=2840188 RepID=A0A947D0E0_9HYPH|nr:TerC family protein [Prosthecodimorpha staleyi]MBT9288256.1 TerC family protein [Prosthecodimorpha staleyi]